MCGDTLQLRVDEVNGDGALLKHTAFDGVSLGVGEGGATDGILLTSGEFVQAYTRCV